MNVSLTGHGTVARGAYIIPSRRTAADRGRGIPQKRGTPRPVFGLEDSADNRLALHMRQRTSLREAAPRELLELVGGQEVADGT